MQRTIEVNITSHCPIKCRIVREVRISRGRASRVLCHGIGDGLGSAGCCFAGLSLCPTPSLWLSVNRVQSRRRRENLAEINTFQRKLLAFSYDSMHSPINTAR